MTTVVSLDGPWAFRLDPQGNGESAGWQQTTTPGDDWSRVTVPHTWQIAPGTMSYFGAAWYHRNFEAPFSWDGAFVRIEFEAVYHTAAVWLNGKPIGSHIGKGYTAFTVDAASALRLGEINHLVVKADNRFDERILPRGHAYDWAPDGGIYRPVSLLITPRVFVERADIEAWPVLESNQANLSVTVVVRNAGTEPARIAVACQVTEDDTGLVVLRQPDAAAGLTIEAESRKEIALPAATWPKPRLWHFDHPNLYRLEVALTRDMMPVQAPSFTFGVRSFETKGAAFYLNGERVWLMGVERMAGSNPQFGMAEPGSWIEHDHDDLKRLNCVFTRVHWQQDKRVPDYCDRHGILMQEEVPAWGGATFSSLGQEPDRAIMQNGLEQLREMIHRDRNHPSIVSWGLCNEINGQNPPAYSFAKRMYDEAKMLDPRRPCSYASNSLQQTPAKDVAGLMDFVEWNEYYGTWYSGGLDDVKRSLKEIHEAFPAKPIVVSEYGYCECKSEFGGGDAARAAVIRDHTRIFSEHDFVGGTIFFCYNDYRTHIGDHGVGALQQRVHGVVDLYGVPKDSYEALRITSSPVESLELGWQDGTLAATVRTRKQLPAYILEGYKLRWIVYAFDDLPMEQYEAALRPLAPGQSAGVSLKSEEKQPSRIQVDVVRPTGFSALTATWHPQQAGAGPGRVKPGKGR